MTMEIMPAALSAGMADMLRVLLTAVGVAAAGCLIWAASSYVKRRKKGRGPDSRQDEDLWKADRDRGRGRTTVKPTTLTWLAGKGSKSVGEENEKKRGGDG